MKSVKLFLVLNIIFLSFIAHGQRWNNDKLVAHYLKEKTRHVFYFEIKNTNKSNYNFQLTRPFNHTKKQGYEFMKVIIECRENDFFYEILPTSKNQKRLYLQPGRYKITLHAKLNIYGDFGNAKYGTGHVNLLWFGHKD